MSILLLLILGLFGLFVVGGIVVVTLLAGNTKSHPAVGIALALGIGAVVLIAGLGVFFLHVATDSVAVRRYPEAPSPVVRLEPARPAIVTESRGEASATVEPKTSTEEMETTAEPEPPARPQWVDAPPGRIGSGDVYQMSVDVGPFMTRQECDQVLPAALREAVATFIGQYRSPEAARSVWLPDAYIRSNIVKEEFVETVKLDPKTKVILEGEEVPSMVRLHARLQFDRAVKSHIDELWRRSVVEQRLWIAGSVLGGIVLLLAILFAVLKIDRATDGNARWRMALAGGIGVVLLLVGSLVGLRIIAGTRLIPTRIEEPPRVEMPSDIDMPSRVDMPYHVDQPLHSEVRVESRAVARPTFVGLLLIPLSLLFLAGLVALLSFKKTRTLGLVVLTLLVIGTLVMVA